MSDFENFDRAYLDEIQELRQKLRLQAAQIAALKTVMVAAAEEIAAHWNAHCDAEGYGPQNLLRRLEEGIPSEYGYTAGAFAALTAERDALRADAMRWREIRSRVYVDPEQFILRIHGLFLQTDAGSDTAERLGAAIDAAIKGQTPDSTPSSV